MEKYYTGTQFKLAFPSKEYYKLTIESECHHSFQFTTGINIISNIFDAQKSNILFDDKEHVLDRINCKVGDCHMKYLRKVQILDDSIIFHDETDDDYVTNKFFLESRVDIYDSDIWNDMDFVEHALKKDLKYLNLIKTIPNQMYLEYIEDEQMLDIERFKNENDISIKIKLIKKFPSQFKLLNDQHKELCDVAIDVDGSNIQHVINPTENQCWKSIFADVNNIQFIKSPTEDMLLCAVSNNKCIPLKIDLNLFTPKILKIMSNFYFNSQNELKIPESTIASTTTDPTINLTTESTPELTPESTPELTTESTPELTPELTPESTPESTTNLDVDEIIINVLGHRIDDTSAESVEKYTSQQILSVSKNIEIVKNINLFLKCIDKARTSKDEKYVEKFEDRKKIVKKFFEYIIKNSQFMKENEKFKVSAINKLKEFIYDDGHTDFKCYLDEINEI